MGTRIVNNRIRGEVWAECALCGFEYPKSQMWKRRGQLVCREECADEDLLSEAEPLDLDPTKRTIMP